MGAPKDPIKKQKYIDNMIKSTKGKVNVGKNHPMYGKKQSEETKEKNSHAVLDAYAKGVKMGFQKGQNSKEKNVHWIDGRSYSNPLYSGDWTDTLREAIRQRDNYICQECGTHQDELTGRFKKLDVHHIDYNKENCNPDNLISLCKKCHMKTNGSRDYWYNHFNFIYSQPNLF